MNPLRRSQERPVDAVVIGASAGGIEALCVLLPRFLPQMKIVVFVVLHLPKERPSLLTEIFAPRCSCRIGSVDDKQPAEHGTIYFAPPDYHLLVDHGPQLALSADAAVNYARPSIDVLFESAADVYGEGLLGIILTGGNDDGAAGLAAVGRAGGRTIVQDPAEAQVSMMPASAIRLRAPDHVLTLAGIAGIIASLPAMAA